MTNFLSALTVADVEPVPFVAASTLSQTLLPVLLIVPAAFVSVAKLIDPATLLLPLVKSDKLASKVHSNLKCLDNQKQ